MIKSILRHYEEEAGQALVEFAIVVPVLLLLVMGLIQFGFIFNGQIILTSAVREGARLAVVNTDDNDVKDRVEASAIALLLDLDRNDIVINRSLPDDALSVRADATVDIIMPLLPMVVGETYTLSAESIMRIE